MSSNNTLTYNQQVNSMTTTNHTICTITPVNILTEEDITFFKNNHVSKEYYDNINQHGIHSYNVLKILASNTSISSLDENIFKKHKLDLLIEEYNINHLFYEELYNNSPTTEYLRIEHYYYLTLTVNTDNSKRYDSRLLLENSSSYDVYDYDINNIIHIKSNDFIRQIFLKNRHYRPIKLIGFNSNKQYSIEELSIIYNTVLPTIKDISQ